VNSEALNTLRLSNTEVTGSNTASVMDKFQRFCVSVTRVSSCTRSLNDSVFRIVNRNGPEEPSNERGAAGGGKNEKKDEKIK
jgi:hypothetical protein